MQSLGSRWYGGSSSRQGDCHKAGASPFTNFTTGESSQWPATACAYANKPERLLWTLHRGLHTISVTWRSMERVKRLLLLTIIHRVE